MVLGRAGGEEHTGGHVMAYKIRFYEICVCSVCCRTQPRECSWPSIVFIELTY